MLGSPTNLLQNVLLALPHEGHQTNYTNDWFNFWLTKLLPKLIKMNLIDIRIFSTQLMLYLKTSCHSLTKYTNGLHLGSNHLCRGTCANFIKTISEALRNRTKTIKQVRFISIVYRLFCHWSRGNTFKKSPLWHSWIRNCVCKRVSNA